MNSKAVPQKELSVIPNKKIQNYQGNTRVNALKRVGLTDFK